MTQQQPLQGTQETSWLQVVTDYDEQTYAALVLLSMKHLRRWPRYGVMIAGTLSLVLAGYVLMSTAHISVLFLLLLFLGNLFMLGGLLAPRLVTRMLVASNKKGEVPKVSYTFFPSYVRVVNTAASRQYAYSDIHRIFDTGTYFVFFFQDKQVYLLNHKNLPPPDVMMLRDFLNQHATRRG